MKYYHDNLKKYEEKEGIKMTKKERKMMIEEIAEKFVGLEPEDKAIIIGYQLGKLEERQKWEKEKTA